MRLSKLIPIIVLALGLLAGGCHSTRKEAVKPAPELKEYEAPKTDTGKKTAEKKRPGKKTKKESVAPKVVAEAHKWIGTKYKYGGHARSGTDCSGLVMQIFEDIAGIKLPRDSRSQQAFVEPLKQGDLVPGDLVFFATKVGGSRVGHVGIYIGKGDFIHSSTSKGVIKSNLDETYYRRHYHSSGRVPGLFIEKEEQQPEAVARKETHDDTPQVTLDRLIELMDAGKEEKGAEPDSISIAVKNAF